MSQKKIAEAILSLHPHKAADVLRRLDERTLIAVGEAILKHEETSRLVKKEYATTAALKREIEPHNSSLEVVKALYRVAFGIERSQELVKKILRRKIQRKLDFLKVYKNDEILRVIQNESPFVISIVLSAMNSRNAAQVLTMFSQAMRAAVISQIAQQKNPEASIINIIEQTLKKKLHELTAREKFETDTGGVKGLSNILRHMDAEAQHILLNDLRDDALAIELEESLFSWELCFSVPKKHMSEILEKFTLYELAKIVTLCGDNACKAITHGLSMRNATLLEDEIALCKNDPMAKMNAKQLQKRLCNAVQNAAKNHVDLHESIEMY